MRTGRRSLFFTPQGEALGRAALKCMNDLAATVNSIRESHQPNSATISTTPSLAARWLLPRLAAFGEAYPWIELSVMAEQKITDPHDISADLAIRMGKGPWNGFDCQPLMDDTLYPVVSRSFWESAKKPGNIKDLIHLPLIHDKDRQAS